MSNKTNASAFSQRKQKFNRTQLAAAVDGVTSVDNRLAVR